MEQELMDVVNEHDETVGRAPLHEVYAKLLPCRIVHIFIFNNENKLLLQFRSKSKESYPSVWGSSVSGHVQARESYEQAAIRELKEELGLGLPLSFAFKDLYLGKSSWQRFVVNFKAISNGPFQINTEEVERLQFFTMEEIKKMIKRDDKFHPQTLFLLEKHYFKN